MTPHLATRPLTAIALAVLATACGNEPADNPSSTGGSAPGTGGAAGGNSSGGSATGGTSSGGASMGGNATGGSGGAAQGCGASTVPAACSTSGSPCHLTVSGTDRTYYVYLPSGYSSSQQYPLVFQFHPMGGTAEQAINMPGIRSNFTAIYVTPQGLTSNGSTGWANTNGVDIAFTKSMIDYVEANWCVDKARIFSTGFSYGGMMSFAVGCEMSDVFRAIAPMSGALYSDFNCRGTGPAIAMWGSHGLSDNVVPIADGRTARDRILQQNHCGSTTTSVDPSPCVAYQGCDSGYPATWCEFDGGHAIPSFASSAIVTFFKQF
jgi:polyhydroxybutyrate depolymerase